MLWPSTFSTAQVPVRCGALSSQRGKAQSSCWRPCRKRKPTPTQKAFPELYSGNHPGWGEVHNWGREPGRRESQVHLYSNSGQMTAVMGSRS